MLWRDRLIVLSLLFRLGFIINKAKSSLVPSQSLTYIGCQFSLAEGFSNTRKSPRSESSSSSVTTGSEYSLPLSCSVGKDSILPGTHSKCQAVHETYPVTFVTKLEPSKNENVIPNSCYTIAKATFEVVVTGSKYSKRPVCATNTICGNVDDRCKSETWLGRSHEQSDSAGTLVKYAEIVSYQLSGNGGSVFDNETLFAVPLQQECIDKNRQYDSCTISESPGGYQVFGTMPSDMETMVNGSGEQYLSQNSSHSWENEPFSGLLVETDSQTDRMVPERNSCTENVFSLGLSTDGSVCNFSEQENTTVLFMDNTSTSFCSRCNVNFLAEPVCLCIPTNTDDSQGVAAYETVSMQDNFHSSTLAETVLVSDNVENVDRLSNEIATLEESVVSREGSSAAPRSSVPESNGMAAVDRQFSTKGFSERSRKLLSSSWRNGTKKDYNSKFKQFNSWCTERNLDPLQPSLNECADFLTSLFEKGLKYRTINGYRSMLSAILPPSDNCPIGQHPYIIRLLKGVFNERPPVKCLIPNWDLSLVLGCLKEAPFEPLKDASFQHLTWKTCFLVAITTFRRCSDLQSLQIAEDKMNIGNRGITFIRTGLAKQDRPNHDGSHIFVPSHQEDKLLDPRRCLMKYIRKTKQYRIHGNQNAVKLFLATRKPHHPISAQTISKWIVNLIKLVYKLKKKSLKNKKIKGHSTRSVGPSCALFKGASFRQVMESADWSTETTFIKHYLKSVRTPVLEV